MAAAQGFHRRVIAVPKFAAVLVNGFPVGREGFASLQLVQRKTENFQRRIVGRNDSAFGIVINNALGHGVVELAVHRLALPKVGEGLLQAVAHLVQLVDYHVEFVLFVNIAGFALESQRFALPIEILAAHEGGDIDQVTGDEEIKYQQNETRHQEGANGVTDENVDGFVDEPLVNPPQRRHRCHGADLLLLAEMLVG